MPGEVERRRPGQPGLAAQAAGLALRRGVADAHVDVGIDAARPGALLVDAAEREPVAPDGRQELGGAPVLTPATRLSAAPRRARAR